MTLAPSSSSSGKESQGVPGGRSAPRRCPVVDERTHAHGRLGLPRRATDRRDRNVHWRATFAARFARSLRQCDIDGAEAANGKALRVGLEGHCVSSSVPQCLHAARLAGRVQCANGALVRGEEGRTVAAQATK